MMLWKKYFGLLYNIYAVGDWFHLINKYIYIYIYITFIETKRSVYRFCHFILFIKPHQSIESTERVKLDL